MLQTITVKSEWTNVPIIANKWLRSIKGPVACDFEVALKYKSKHMQEMKDRYEAIKDNDNYFFEAKELYAKIKATALSHPSHCYITHFSFAEAEDNAKVIVINNQKMAKLVLTWLITTNVTQIWHNASFDFKHIYYHTNKFPKNYEDTQIASKCLLNHVETYKANTGLKELMGVYYGKWAVTADYFSRDEIYNKDLIHYAAIDSAATYKLWLSLQEYLQEKEENAATT